MNEKALADENYRLFTENPLYGKLAAMLQEVAVNKNFTGASGNAHLEATFADACATFKWTYAFNGVIAPSKFVAICFKNGHLTAFVDNWQVHEVGSTTINLSEKEALEIALDAALKHSWSISLEAETLRNLKVSWAELIFDHSVGTDNPCSENLLQLYPVWRVGISLDKWYGHLYGIEIDIWADNKQLRRVREAWSTLPPPEGVLTANLSTPITLCASIPETAPYEMLSSNAHSSTYAYYNAATAFIVPALCMIAVPPLVAYRKEKRCYIKIAGTLLCLTILMVMLLQSMPAKASQTMAAVIWGSESTRAYDPRIGCSWRKHPTEIQCQRYISNIINSFFSNNGYTAYNRQGDPGSLKSNILSTLSSLQSNFDRLTVYVLPYHDCVA